MSNLFDDDSNSKKNKSEFEKLLDQSSSSQSELKYHKGDSVQGKVVSIGKTDVFLLVDSKEAICPKSELLVDGQLRVQTGETLKLFVVMLKEGLLYLTVKASSKALSEDLQEAFEMESAVEGRVMEVVNGGFRVQVLGKLAFCPLSQMELGMISDSSYYVGKKFEFLVTKIEGGGRNVVLSRRKLLELEKAASEGAFMQEYKPGDTLIGRVRRLENFGAFVEVRPSIEGLVHISEINWSRISHPSEVLKLGDQVNVKIIKIEEDQNGKLKISLSIKQAGEDPYLEAVRTIQVGSVVTGKLKEKERFGWLVELKPGVIGLIPQSSLKDSLDIKELESKKTGETLQVLVQSVQVSERRISLLLPSEQDDISWKEFDKKLTGGFGSLADQFQAALKKNQKK